MSLGQLTANYTDSEGEESMSDDEKLLHKIKENIGIPTSHSNSPATPQKKVNRLVSYYNEDEDEDAADIQDEPDEILQPEPMDTGTDDGEDDKPTDKHTYGIALPSPPAQKCSQRLQDKVSKIVNEVRRGNKDYNVIIQNKKEFRNPSIYEKLIDLLALDEMGSNYPLEIFDPHCWDKESFYDNLARVQKEEMDKREKERKERSKIDYVMGSKKPAEEEKKRKSRFDQAIPNAIGPNVPVPLPSLTTVPTGKKTTIEAFGSLKKSSSK